VTTGWGDDRLIGSSADNVLTGGAGDDILQGKAGADHLVGGIGDDLLKSADAFADDDDCGIGADTAMLDGADAPHDCEALV
jgi:Ca2+-binding RTX toxin-like protein